MKYNLIEKTIMITGANSGIGKAAELTVRERYGSRARTNDLGQLLVELEHKLGR